MKKSVLCETTLLKQSTESNSNLINFERYNSFRKLVRVYAWIKSFIDNSKSKIASNRLFAELTIIELSKAKEKIIKDHQRTLSDDPNLAQIRRELNIQTDENGVFRCYDCLQSDPLTFETKSPMYLDRSHKICEMIVNDTHLQNMHSGVKQTLADLRQQYWITKGRSYVQNILKNCHVCKRYHGKPYSYPDPPPITELHLRENRLFSVTGVDLCGPLFVKNIFHGEFLYKAWIVLCRCVASSGIVLHVVPRLSANAFLRSLKRFISRRDCLGHIISDNGTNFVASETFQNHLRQTRISCGILTYH